MLLAGLMIVAVVMVAAALFIVRKPRDVAGRPAQQPVEQDPKASLVRVCTDGEPGAVAIPAALALPPLQQLYAQLCHAVAAERRQGYSVNVQQPAESFARLDACIRRLIQNYMAAGHKDWRNFSNFNDHHYVRHLVDHNSDFELMLICWKHGQASRVHNHANSHCWLTVLDGSVVEEKYLPVAEDGGTAASAGAPALPGVLRATAPCPALVPTSTQSVPTGATAYINDLQGLHAVRCGERCPGQGAVTLHLYAPPIRRVRLFEPDNDRVVERQPGFFTMRGKRVAEAR